MTLKIYDKNLLNFMYELTKLDKFYSSYALSKKITLEGGRKVTPRTIQKWFKFLREPWEFQGKKIDKFSYFPTFFYEKLGLQRVFVFLEFKKKKINLKDLFKEIPYYDYVTWLHDLNKNKEILLISYLIPKENLEKFKEKLKRHKAITNYIIYFSSKPFIIYSPWYKVIDNNGLFQPELNSQIEIEKQLKLFGYYIDNLSVVEPIQQIKKNPLIIPTLFEYVKENWTSPKVWQTIREKLGKDVWLYIRKRKKLTDSVGIKRIQQSINLIHRHELFHQIRITYLPTELKNNFFIYLLLKFNNKNKLFSIISKIALNSIFMNNYILRNNKILVVALVNCDSFQSILDVKGIEKIFLLKHKKSLPLILDSYKFQYHKLFDPEKCCWKKI